MPTLEPIIRRATPDDSQACFAVSWTSISDLAARTGNPWDGSADDHWPRFRDLYGLLADIAVEWWIAEDASDHEIIGYARSVERGNDGGLFELAELFVLPGRQSSGVGRTLLERAFPIGRGAVRVIVATADLRAVARYHKADTSIQFPILGMSGAPRADADQAISLEPQRATADDLAAIAVIERTVLEYERGERELRWLLDQREGYLYRHEGAVLGVAFIGMGGSGPIAAMDPAALPDMLSHVEARAAALGRSQVAFEVPSPNVTAIRHLLGRGFLLDPFVTYLMANRPFGKFDRFIGFSPPFVL